MRTEELKYLKLDECYLASKPKGFKRLKKKVVKCFLLIAEKLTQPRIL